MLMTHEEICIKYQELDKSAESIQYLAMLNNCTADEIRAVILAPVKCTNITEKELTVENMKRESHNKMLAILYSELDKIDAELQKKEKQYRAIKNCIIELQK